VVEERHVALALEHGVTIGAHPAYPDLVGFGRRSMACSPEEIRDLILYWVADEGEFPIDPPSEGWMAEALGVDRYTLRTMRDKAFERAELFMRRYSDWRLAKYSRASASSSPPPSDGL
jgi:hypothetical protein